MSIVKNRKKLTNLNLLQKYKLNLYLFFKYNIKISAQCINF